MLNQVIIGALHGSGQEQKLSPHGFLGNGPQDTLTKPFRLAHALAFSTPRSLIPSWPFRSTSMISFRKTRQGDWAVFGPASEMNLGTVSACRRDGTVRRVNVVGMSRPFNVSGTPHVFGYLTTTEAPSQPAPVAQATPVDCEDASDFCGW